MQIKFTVPAIPVAQPRARATVRAGHAAVYTPTKHAVHAFKATVRLAFKHAYAGPPLSGPMRVDATFVFPRPANLRWKTRPMPRRPHAKKPDRDNVDKALLDALSGLLFVDDCQVCDGRLVKVIASGDEQPHVEVVVTLLSDL